MSNFTHKYLELPKLNIEILLGKGKMTLARNPRLSNSIVPIDYNKTVCKSSKDGSEIVCIMIGQLNDSKDFFVPNGIGRTIELYTIRDKDTNELIGIKDSQTHLSEGQFD